MAKLWLLAIITLHLTCSHAKPPQDKFQFFLNEAPSLSLNGPFDPTNINYTPLGNVDITRYSVKLGRNAQDSSGSIWSKGSARDMGWQVYLAFRIRGDPVRGDNGLTFWYTERPTDLAETRLGTEGGEVYRDHEKFVGLALKMETAEEKVKDASTEATMKIHPDAALISGMIGDGNKLFGMISPMGRCLKKLRNLKNPVYLRLTYLSNILKVEFDNQDEGKTFNQCFEIKDIILPPNLNFGVSFSTGSNPDDYEIYRLRVMELEAAPKMPEHFKLLSDMEKKITGKDKVLDETPFQQVSRMLEDLYATAENSSKQLAFIIGSPGPETVPLVEQVKHLDMELHRLTDKVDELGMSLTQLVRGLGLHEKYDKALRAKNSKKEPTNDGSDEGRSVHRYIIKRIIGNDSSLLWMVLGVQAIILVMFLIVRLNVFRRKPKKYL